MNRSVRVLAACWLVVAFLLLRMAWGGSLFGIVYVLNFNPPAVLIAGATSIAGAFAVVLLVARGAIPLGNRVSIVLASLTIPLSIVLATEDHGSAPAVGAASVIALAISIRAVRSPASRGALPPG